MLPSKQQEWIASSMTGLSGGLDPQCASANTAWPFLPHIPHCGITAIDMFYNCLISCVLCPSHATAELTKLLSTARGYQLVHHLPGCAVLAMLL